MSKILSKHATALRRRLTIVGPAGLLALITVVAGTAAAPASAAGTAAPVTHAKQRLIHPAGRGHARAARIRNFRTLASAWRAAHKVPNARPPRVRPFAAFTTAFDGISQGSCSGCITGDPSVATSADGAQLVEATPNFVQVYDKNGTTLCDGGMTLNAFFGAAVSLPQVQYDDLTNQFILVADQDPNRRGSAVYVAATTGHDACGNWHVAKLTLSGGPFTATSDLDELYAGQDASAVLLTALTFDIATVQDTWTVIAVPKAAIYAGTPLSAASFTVQTAAKPVTMAGNPMISSPASYFLSADDPSHGITPSYWLYTMTGSGTAAPTLSLTPLGHPFHFPRPANVSPLLGGDPVFDGTRIWFSHSIGDGTDDVTSVRYGFADLRDDSMTFGQITDPGNNWEAGSSVAVTPTSDGSVSVFLDWTNWTASPPDPQLNLVKSFIYPGRGALPGNTPATDQVIESDGAGSFLQNASWAAADPGTANGLCAVTAQLYFRPDRTWVTRVRRKCGPASPATMPSVTGDSAAAAVAAVQAAGLTPAVTDVTTQGVSCNATTAGTIFAQDPLPGPVSIGAPVSLFFCDLATTTVPNVAGDTQDQATAALQAASLTLGSVIATTSCSPRDNGLIIAASPASGTTQVTGTPVNLQLCTNNRATVPDVTGDTPDLASEEISSAGLTPGPIKSTTSCDVPAGTVARTSPPAHDTETPGTTVIMFVSTGRPPTCN